MRGELSTTTGSGIDLSIGHCLYRHGHQRGWRWCSSNHRNNTGRGPATARRVIGDDRAWVVRRRLLGNIGRRVMRVRHTAHRRRCDERRGHTRAVSSGSVVVRQPDGQDGRHSGQRGSGRRQVWGMPWSLWNTSMVRNIAVGIGGVGVHEDGAATKARGLSGNW